jgi:hypothetical protein
VGWRVGVGRKDQHCHPLPPGPTKTNLLLLFCNSKYSSLQCVVGGVANLMLCCSSVTVVVVVVLGLKAATELS